MVVVTPSKTCFIAMPVSTSRADTERYRDDDQHWMHVLEGIFVPAVVAAGFDPIRPTTEGSDLIHSRIVKHLQEADMVLCDLSGHNPNVFFEMGVRTATNLPIALVRDEHTSLPFDTGGINTHSYKSTLNTWDAAEEVQSLSGHLTSSEEACDGSNPLWRTFGLTLTATDPAPGESQEDARWELVTRELADIRNAIASAPTPAERKRMQLELLTVESAPTPTLRAFAKDTDVLGEHGDIGTGAAPSWYWSTSDHTSVFVSGKSLDGLHIATRRALMDTARNRGLEIVEIPG